MWPRGKHDPERTATRHGTEAGSVTLGGRRVPVRRPRVRATDGSGEVSVPAYELFNGTELLGRMAMERMLAGVSTRRYPTALEPVGQSVAAESKSTSRSAVSRKFLAMTESAMADPLAVDRHRGLARGSVPRVLGRAIGDRERAFLDGPVAGGAVDAELCERFVSGHARVAGGVRDQRRHPRRSTHRRVGCSALLPCWCSHPPGGASAPDLHQRHGPSDLHPRCHGDPLRCLPTGGCSSPRDRVADGLGDLRVEGGCT